MLLYLSPVLLLALVFPAAVGRIAGVEVGDAPLTTLLLACSLTVPWLSVATCMPLYRTLGRLLSESHIRAVRARFVQVWPATLAQSIPLVLLFAVPMQLVMRWSLTALLTYVSLCLLHVAFAQSLVVANLGRDRKLWAAAWAGYAAALILGPTVWFLPPLVGLLTQLGPLRVHLLRTRVGDHLDHRDVAENLLRGTLLGSVPWAHLLFLFLSSEGGFNVIPVFIAVLPAILAYNYYFVRLAPKFDAGVVRLREALENEPHTDMARYSSALYVTVSRSIQRTAFIGAVFAFGVSCAVQVWESDSVALVAAAGIASWLFLMTTLLCYKLDYLGCRREAQIFSGLHLVICILAFAILPPGAVLYSWLIAFELVIFAVAFRTTLEQWRSSEYALFWRHAMAW